MFATGFGVVGQIEFTKSQGLTRMHFSIFAGKKKIVALFTSKEFLDFTLNSFCRELRGLSTDGAI